MSGQAASPLPPGLRYQPDFVTAQEEAALCALFDQLSFSSVEMHGQVARRQVVHFGWVYGYERWTLVPGPPTPEGLLWLRERAARWSGLAPDRFGEVLVTRYPPGAGIGWHRDAPAFGPEVVGVSLAGPGRLRFQRVRAGSRETAALELAPRSAYLLAGPARSQWQHALSPVAALRYSVTFRSVRRAPLVSAGLSE